MKNIRIVIQYDGTKYRGWQRQRATDMTIQGKIEDVLTKMCGRPTTIDGAGRTDAGVHARAQVANFHMDTPLSEREIQEYLNTYLPQDIRIIKVEQAGERFHSRLNATHKTYCYQLVKADCFNVFARNYAVTVENEISLEAMQKAANQLIGKHDFAGFCSKASKKKSTVRDMQEINFIEDETMIRVFFTGDGFLYNMIRILMGTLLEVGRGERRPEQMAELLEHRERKAAGETAPAKGLTLWEVEYD